VGEGVWGGGFGGGVGGFGFVWLLCLWGGLVGRGGGVVVVCVVVWVGVVLFVGVWGVVWGLWGVGLFGGAPPPPPRSKAPQD